MDNSIDFAPDYDPKEFAPLSLLERGDVDVWVRRRGAFLLDKSKEIAKDCEASKLASAITIGASVVMSSNPLAWLPLTIGALGYAYTVFQEFQDTGSIRIIPMYRGKLGDIISIMEGGSATPRHPLEDQIEYLSEAEKDEALLVNYRFGEIASILNSAPPKVRFDLYRHLCGQFHARRDIITLDEVKHYISSAVSEARRSFVIPNTPAVELEQTPIAELPVTSTVSLNEQGGTEALATRTAAVQVSAQNITVNFFDFTRLRTEPDKFAHLRVIGGTGIGKTTFVDWLLDTLGGERFVITPKKKSWNWVGLKVYGLWFDYETIRAKLQWIHAEMYRRYPLMEQGETFEITNFVVDEWRLINTNVKAIKERDPETKQTLEIAPSAKAMMKDIITVARESMLRLIALAQGENVASWGFEGESDLEECFTDIRLGEFAIDYAKSLRNQCRKDSDDYEYWTAVLGELDRQSQQRTYEDKSIPCCMVGKHPARIPDLTDWKRDISDSTSAETPSTQLTKTDPSTPASGEATLPGWNLTHPKAEDARKPDDNRLEGFCRQVTEAKNLEASDTLPPLLDGLDRDGKLLMLRALLSQNLGKEKTILLAWGQKSGGRNHEKYKYAAELLEAMTRELNGLGFNDENNWGLGDVKAN
ncbi:hypothetical protein [Allocoleopsis franciscana]|uniref:Uncharacterized protein n=1 Tax=Allocoleopsis franciscana PCC 7113 TaxID=1173027 RepID=K9WQ44_9CYAN|nr:hypothetical protein [Allocoleopsis franciscana]AFZ22298.1 hypothetical protein Mic7113_6736 [Allocoleopsis franciscana PCC 7113]